MPFSWCSPPLLVPLVTISIAVDTAYVVGKSGQKISKGIYMMDNMIYDGSTNEGMFDLNTRCAVGDLVGFHVVPINALSSLAGTTVITGFKVNKGNVFTASGMPQPQSVFGDYWVGQAVHVGRQCYQIQLKVTNGGLSPIPYYINWTAVLTAC